MLSKAPELTELPIPDSRILSEKRPIFLITYILVVDFPDATLPNDLNDCATELAIRLHPEDLTLFEPSDFNDEEGLAALRKAAHLPPHPYRG